MGEKVIFINGFTKDEVIEIMRAVKNTIKKPENIAFCMGTEQNIEWKVKELIEHVMEEHNFMKNRANRVISSPD